VPIFRLKLEKTYYEKGFFNVPVDFDRYVLASDGLIELILGKGNLPITGKVYRTANQNGTARIWGGAKLRDWFKANFKSHDIVTVDFTSLQTAKLY